MKAIKKLIIFLVFIIMVLSVSAIGGYIYVRTTYGIDLFRTAGQLKTLTEKTDESILCPNAYSDKDFVDMKNEVNKRIDGLIVYEEDKGYNGYSVNFDALNGKSIENLISLTEKQVGAIAQTILFEQKDGKIKIGEKDVQVTIMQVDFSNFSENGSADFNVVAKLDLASFKNDMDKFPYKYFKKYIPDNLYVSSTVRIDKLEESGFIYTVTHKALMLNNLSADDTANLFDTLNSVLKIGTAENLNIQVGKSIVDALIGTKENPGFGYSMKAIGATTFNFATVSNVDWFIVY